jgi:aminoglycoside phosphotransferase family enzyme/predicted kinase
MKEKKTDCGQLTDQQQKGGFIEKKPDMLREISEKMKRPDFYPHPADGIEIKETHISRVFLAGEFVYKIKKPLDLGFLDFTTIEKRRHFCTLEVELNQRLTKNIYLGVVSITISDKGYELGGPGPVVEYAVKMQRLADKFAMASLLDINAVDDKKIRLLLDVLTKFYSETKIDKQAEKFGSRKFIAADCHENFAQTACFAENLFDSGLFETIRKATAAFLRRKRPLFEKRLKSGKIKDCHGDLRTDHIYFMDDQVQIIDCIEFNERFRYGDIASDIAFLLMDLDSRGHGTTAENILSQYFLRTGDSDLMLLADFYKCYRAMVRFKVFCIRAGESDVNAAEKKRLKSAISKHIQLAGTYAAGFSRPFLWIVCGIPASGKSTIAEKLSKALEIPKISSDVIRKSTFSSLDKDFSGLEFETGIYSRDVTEKTYEIMLVKAREYIETGTSVILDATFGSKKFRADLLCLAANADSNIFFVECIAPDSVLKKRLAHRDSEPVVSDARLRHFDLLQSRFEPLDEIHPEEHIEAHTQNTPDQCIKQILGHLSAMPL